MNHHSTHFPEEVDEQDAPKNEMIRHEQPRPPHERRHLRIGRRWPEGPCSRTSSPGRVELRPGLLICLRRLREAHSGGGQSRCICKETFMLLIFRPHLIKTRRELSHLGPSTMERIP